MSGSFSWKEIQTDLWINGISPHSTGLRPLSESLPKKHLSLHLCLSVCPSFCLYVCLSVCLIVYQSVYLYLSSSLPFVPFFVFFPQKNAVLLMLHNDSLILLSHMFISKRNIGSAINSLMNANFMFHLK